MERLYCEPGGDPGYLDECLTHGEREPVNRPVNAWNCSSCGTAGFAEQNFCRRCGAPRPAKRPAPITAQVPVIRREAKDPDTRKPLSRVRIALIAALFLVIGGLGALIVDDLRGAEPVNPADQPTVTTPSGEVVPTTATPTSDADVTVATGG